MWQSLHDAWWRLATQNQPRSFADALASCALSGASVAYRGLLAVRNVAYKSGWAKSARLPCPVVSVGNLTVGGTGKTACVELIVKKLAALGKSPAVLSRGYGGKQEAYWLRFEDGFLLVSGKCYESTLHLADEPRLLAHHLPGINVLVGARRDVSGFQACSEFGASVVVLDDGFQHRSVIKDCEIVLINARMPLGGWAILPRGPMREPLGSLKRAHVVIITKADEALDTLGALKERMRAFSPSAAFVTAIHESAFVIDGITQERFEPKRINGMRVGLLSSIGDPEGFESTVRRLHATILWHISFPDHHPYCEEDWIKILDRLNAQRPDVVLTTEKDWVRLEDLARKQPRLKVPIWVLGIRMKIIDGEEKLNARLDSLFAS